MTFSVNSSHVAYQLSTFPEGGGREGREGGREGGRDGGREGGKEGGEGESYHSSHT